MANTVTRTEQVIEITGIDSDFDLNDYLGYTADTVRTGLYVHSIQFTGGAQNNELIVKNVDASGAVLFDPKVAAVTDQRILYLNGVEIYPYIDQSECTLSAGHKVIIILEKRL